MILCYVTDRASLPASGLRRRSEHPRQEDAEFKPQFGALLTSIAAAAAAGVDWIQIREKDLSARDFCELTRAALQLCAATSTKILINDRVDIVLAERAAGVHLGENSLPIREVRGLLQRSFDNNRGRVLAGVSCHSLASAQAAAVGGADYLVFGPVFQTPSKAAFGPAQGLAQLAEVCRAVSIPVLAIGGVTLANAAACREAGAAGIAAIRLFQESGEQRGNLPGLQALH
jgi:thiamine-phosphate pyrophosphorylase